MDENKFLELIKKDGLLGILIALLIYFGTALQNNQIQLNKQLLNIKMKLVQIENKMVDEDKVVRIVERAITNHQKVYHTNQSNQ